MYIARLIRSLKPYRVEHWVMLSILFYSMVGVLKYYVPNAVCNAIISLSAMLFILVIFRNIRSNPFTGWTGIAYTILILWSVCLTFHMFFIADVRGTFVEYKGLTTWILAYLGSMAFLPNLLPFTLLLFPKRYKFDFCYLWRIMWLMCILYICYYPFAFWSMIHYSWTFESSGAKWGEAGTYGDFIVNSTKGIASLAPMVIMVYFKEYLQKKQWCWFLVAYIGSILIAAYLARRGGFVMSVLYLTLVWWMYALNNKRTSKVKMVFMAVIVGLLGFVLFTNMNDSFFSTLIERGVEDSRSGVENSFYTDMGSMSDWVFGRGWFGQYYDSGFDRYRTGLETGFLTLILRGGLFYLIPYVVILILTFIKGYFLSNNLFCKSFALICLMQVINLYPFGWPSFNFFHFIIWLGVWVCNSSLRRLTDREIQEYAFKY